MPKATNPMYDAAQMIEATHPYASTEPHPTQRGWRRALKRAFDLAAAAAAAPLAAPLSLATAAAVRLSMGSPVLFAQQRPGKHGRLFTAYKFRTMRDAKDASGRPLPDGERLTAAGRFIRKTSLDELPQLWNVLRGEMSLVGPRPLLVEYLPRYSREQFRRHGVMPGITGWAQVCGRNATSWRERFEQDLFYVDNWSLALDLKILWRTARKVLVREGVSAEGHQTMPVFMGNDEQGIPYGDLEATPMAS
jgi:sugar transferase EpsL